MSETDVFEELRKLDCRDNSCRFSENKTGQRTNGGCTCLSTLPPKLKRELERFHWDMMKSLKQAAPPAERTR